MTKNFLFLSFLLIAVPAGAEDNEPVRIGVIESLTGLAAEDGNNVLNALQLAAKDLNKNQTQVELKVEDDKSSPKDTVSAYQKLVQSGVDAIIVGPYGFTTESVIPLAGRQKIVLLNTSAMHESFNASASNGYFFNNSISIVEDIKPFEKFLDANPKESAVLVNVPSSWGRVQQKAYADALANHQIKLLESIETQAQDNNDWQTLITRIAALKPSLIVLLLNKNDIDLFLKKAAEQKLAAAIFSSKNTYDAWRLDQISPTFENVCFTYPYQQLLGNGQFVEKFKSEFKVDPRIFADTSYDAVQILNHAVRTARKTNEKLKSVLMSSSFKGIVGDYHFSPERSLAISKSSLLCIKNNNLTVN